MHDDAHKSCLICLCLFDSQGFDVGNFSHFFACGRIEPMGITGVLNDDDKKQLGEFSMEAIHMYNTEEIFS